MSYAKKVPFVLFTTNSNHQWMHWQSLLIKDFRGDFVLWAGKFKENLYHKRSWKLNNIKLSYLSLYLPLKLVVIKGNQFLLAREESELTWEKLKFSPFREPKNLNLAFLMIDPFTLVIPSSLVFRFARLSKLWHKGFCLLL